MTAPARSATAVRGAAKTAAINVSDAVRTAAIEVISVAKDDSDRCDQVRLDGMS